MPMINGLGGAFLFSRDPKRLADWYQAHLGLQFESDEKGESFFLVFLALNPDDKSSSYDTTFAILPSSQDFSRPIPDSEPHSMYGDQPYMLNLRTSDLEALLHQLENLGVPVIRRDEIEYGKFAWVRDADGNRLELYQPSTLSESLPT